jgi:hypothetical protein
MTYCFDIVELTPLAPSLSSTSKPLREIAFRPDAWLPDEMDDLVAMFLADRPIGDIADRLGRTRAAVQTRIYELGLRRNSTQPWTEQDDSELSMRYGNEPTAAVAQSLGRSCSAVYARASILGLSEANPPGWTQWEDAQLAEGYRRAIPIQQIAILIGRPLSGTASRASALGLRHPNHPADWSDAELGRALQLAEDGLPYREIMAVLEAEGFPKRSKAGFGSKLRATGYGRGWGRNWIDEEDCLLRKAYAQGLSLTPLQTRLGRSNHSIRWRAEYLGLRGHHPNKNGFRQGPDWSEDDLATLREEYGRTPTPQLAKKLGRTKAAVFTRANVLGLQHGYIKSWDDGDHDALVIAFRNGIAIADLALALDRKAMSVSKYAKQHGFAFGRRPRLPFPPSKELILSLNPKEEGEGQERLQINKEAHHAAHDRQTDCKPGNDHQGHTPVQRDAGRHTERAPAKRTKSRRKPDHDRLRRTRRHDTRRRVRRWMRN